MIYLHGLPDLWKHPRSAPLCLTGVKAQLQGSEETTRPRREQEHGGKLCAHELLEWTVIRNEKTQKRTQEASPCLDQRSAHNKELGTRVHCYVDTETDLVPSSRLQTYQQADA